MRKKSVDIGIVGVLGLIALLIAAAAGWVMNIAAIVHTLSDPLTGVFIFRCVGIFIAPLGAILGYF